MRHPLRRVTGLGRLLCGLVLLLSALPACAGTAVHGVGLARFEVADPVTGATMPGYVFYPAGEPARGETAVGPYHVAASFGARALPGRKPLVILSHGHGGSSLGHHDLATYLAAHGFVVAAIEHPKDNFHDMSGTGTAAVLAGRAVQVRATLDALLAQPRWRALVDPSRIGVAGFSAGGYTSLLVIGAEPRFDRFIGYCRRHPEDAEICAAAQKLTPAALAAYLADVQKDLHRWGPTADPRVKAAFVMAPLALLFDADGARHADRPVDLWYGADDHVLLPPENALHIAPLLPHLVRSTAVPKADHWVFLAPCSAELAKDAGAICRDPPGVDRARVHARIDADALAFFRQALGVPAR